MRTVPVMYRDTPLWALHLNFRTIDCALRQIPFYGWEVRVAFERGVYESRTCRTREEALAFAEAKRQDLLAKHWGESPQHLVRLSA
jgi:hypothetical protein